MRGQAAVLMCDAEDGLCGAWDADYYEQGANSVGVFRITDTTRAPGWISTDESDLCPEHAASDGAR